MALLIGFAAFLLAFGVHFSKQEKKNEVAGLISGSIALGSAIVVGGIAHVLIGPAKEAEVVEEGSDTWIPGLVSSISDYVGFEPFYGVIVIVILAFVFFFVVLSS